MRHRRCHGGRAWYGIHGKKTERDGIYAERTRIGEPLWNRIGLERDHDRDEAFLDGQDLGNEVQRPPATEEVIDDTTSYN